VPVVATTSPYITFADTVDDVRELAKPAKPCKIDQAPRFVTFSGIEAPKLHDLLGAQHTGRLPLHAIPEAVATVSLARLIALHMHDDVRDKLNPALR
jgi:hypothetical protein